MQLKQKYGNKAAYYQDIINKSDDQKVLKKYSKKLKALSKKMKKLKKKTKKL